MGNLTRLGLGQAILFGMSVTRDPGLNLPANAGWQVDVLLDDRLLRDFLIGLTTDEVRYLYLSTELCKFPCFAYQVWHAGLEKRL